MKTYYTEFPTSQFKAENDIKAMEQSNARVIYKESETPSGLPFIMIRDILFSRIDDPKRKSK